MKFKRLISDLAALKHTPWYRWHPQLAMRYLPVVEEIRKEEGKRPSALRLRLEEKKEKGRVQLSILEVGSGGLGIAPYLKFPITGLDIRFESPIYPLLKPVVGDAANLKFDENSFDIAVSMDMLEHLPKEKRKRAITELLRVAGRQVIIGVPCGKEAEEHDRKMMARLPRLAKNGTSVDGEGLKFMNEHREFGLPEETDILPCIENAAKKMNKKIKIKVKGNMNINMREFLMKGWMKQNWLSDILFRKVFLLFIPVFRILDRPPFYRKIFIINVLRNK